MLLEPRPEFRLIRGPKLLLSGISREVEEVS